MIAQLSPEVAHPIVQYMGRTVATGALASTTLFSTLGVTRGASALLRVWRLIRSSLLCCRHAHDGSPAVPALPASAQPAPAPAAAVAHCSASRLTATRDARRRLAPPPPSRCACRRGSRCGRGASTECEWRLGVSRVAPPLTPPLSILPLAVFPALLLVQHVQRVQRNAMAQQPQTVEGSEHVTCFRGIRITIWLSPPSPLSLPPLPPPPSPPVACSVRRTFRRFGKLTRG